MLKIGITGGIGSGKSTVCKVFEVMGIPVFYADQAAKSLMASDSEIRETLVQTFGKDTYQQDGTLNRAHLANLVFKDAQKLEKLNQIVHPAVFKAFDEWCAKQFSPYVVKEAALLFESNSYQMCNYTILVCAPEELKIKRISKRDGSNRTEILARMAKQMTDSEKIKLADFLLINDEQQLLIPQILELHRQFIKGGENC